MPSLNPKKFSTGTIFEEGVYEWTNCRWEEYDYNGRAPRAVLALAVDLVGEDGEVHDQRWSAGDLKHFAPSEDGSDLLQVGSRETLTNSTNVYDLMKSLLDAGFPEDRFDQIGSKVAGYNGLRTYIVWRDQKSREGLAEPPKQVLQSECERENVAAPAIGLADRLHEQPRCRTGPECNQRYRATAVHVFV